MELRIGWDALRRQEGQGLPPVASRRAGVAVVATWMKRLSRPSARGLPDQRQGAVFVVEVRKDVHRRHDQRRLGCGLFLSTGPRPCGATHHDCRRPPAGANLLSSAWAHLTNRRQTGFEAGAWQGLKLEISARWAFAPSSLRLPGHAGANLPGHLSL